LADRPVMIEPLASPSGLDAEIADHRHTGERPRLVMPAASTLADRPTASPRASLARLVLGNGGAVRLAEAQAGTTHQAARLTTTKLPRTWQVIRALLPSSSSPAA
jgi:hypothetical protein